MSVALEREIKADSFLDVMEMFQRNGWTDGLPIVPPTPERVAEFLAAANLKPDEEIGFYEERSRPVIAEKLATNAVMAGCLPEYFPVVVAIVRGILTTKLGLHVANASTGSFTYGFIVNGPIRHKLGMNFNGNVLGPGNRANSTIGRALRLIQINVLGSVGGAGGEEPDHGRPVLDRSTMGQPAKYAGYHIVENEELFPQLRPTHVELGYQPDESVVTVLNIGGYIWIDAHAEKTPEAFIDSVAHYIVGSGRLVNNSYGVLLLPPENALMFAEAGWTKADIREALFEKTKRSIAWMKENGWRTRMQRERLVPVRPGDEEVQMAMAASASPKDLYVVVCGGPAGGMPFYLYSTGRYVAQTQKIVP